MWKKHPIYENYEANENGEIRSLNYKKRGEVKIIKQTRKSDGYLTVRVDGKSIFSHRFVWECFNGLLTKGEAIDHRNTNRTDNRLENLNKGDYTSNMGNELTRLHLREAKAKQCGKKVLKLDKHTGEILGWYPSIAEATRANKISCTNYIRYVCEGRKGFYTAGGFKWRYTDDCYTCKWGKWWVTECEYDYEQRKDEIEPSETYENYSNATLWKCPGSKCETKNMIIVPGDTKADVIVRLKSIMKEDEDKDKVKKARYALRHQDRWEIYDVVMFL